MAQERLLSLDVMRGLTVIGMIFVNSVAVFHYGQEVPAYGAFLHADWAGLTVADLVFPFFIVMVGVAIPFALSGLKAREGLTGATVWRLFKRAAILFGIGLILTLSFHGLEEPLRIPGVLQRIGLTFFFAALLFMVCEVRTIAILAALSLLIYFALVKIPVSGLATDLYAPGQNFSSWLDSWLLGQHIYVRTGPAPFDPEGILGTLPSVGQALFGVLAGIWLKEKGVTPDSLKRLALVGTGLLVLGFVWTPIFPVVKALWSSSFVLVTTGLAFLLLAFLGWLLDVRKVRGSWATFMQAFGINAITGYVLHTYLMGPMLENPVTGAIYGSLAGVLPGEAAMLVPVMLVIGATWLPLYVMQRRGIILKV
ncbi:MAG: DUF5009 domain-containing protein [Alphaproteobacteria bacterium]|nr:MAG: DUF5009 domain-containing protein [Alphaproteobacteria bacterium]